MECAIIPAPGGTTGQIRSNRTRYGGAAPYAPQWYEFVLALALIATKPSDKPLIPVIKDAIYMLAYGVFLTVAIPGTGE
ncbi:MAG: hypothetical protein ACTSWM_00280 [Alphaproteobacteria bacterium]